MKRQSKRQLDEVQIDMTPMLDIVFIILIFFILTTSFVREAVLELHRSQASQAKAEQPDASLVIQADERVSHGVRWCQNEIQANENGAVGVALSLASCCLWPRWLNRPGARRW